VALVIGAPLDVPYTAEGTVESKRQELERVLGELEVRARRMLTEEPR
jgi:hypothetical protein